MQQFMVVTKERDELRETLAKTTAEADARMQQLERELQVRPCASATSAPGLLHLFTS